jgi:hypothetical protein
VGVAEQLNKEPMKYTNVVVDQYTQLLMRFSILSNRYCLLELMKLVSMVKDTVKPTPKQHQELAQWKPS